MKTINIDHVTKIYSVNNQQIKANDNICLKISKGDSIAISGPSGSGKTTLLLFLGGLIRPTEGNVYYDDINIWQHEMSYIEKARKNCIGFMFQHYNLLEYLSVLENLSLTIRIKNNIKATDAHYRSLEFLEKFKLEHKANSYPYQLSAGEQRRISLIRALIKKPDVLIIDEPTANLDEINAHFVLSEIMQYFEEYKPILVITCHDVNASRLMKKQLVLREGRLTQETKNFYIGCLKANQNVKSLHLPKDKNDNAII